MHVFFLFLFAMSVTIIAENDESWTWSDDKQKISRNFDNRYQVHETLEHFVGGPQLGFRPQNQGFYGPNRPFVPGYQGNKDILVGPGGPTGIINRPRFDPNRHNNLNSIPPWIRGDPRYRHIDTCACRYSFNCPSSGLQFGRCAGDKKYCCFNSKQFLQGLSGELPHYLDTLNKYGSNYGNRRPYGSGYQRPSLGNYYQGSYGGDYDESFRPYPYDSSEPDYDVINERSLSKNQTQINEKLET